MTIDPSNSSTDVFEFLIPEARVLEKTGLARRDLRLRRGPAGVWWQKIGARLLWSGAGVAALEREIAERSLAPVLPEKIAPLPVAVMIVARRRNPRVLHVTDAGRAYDPLLPVCVWLPQPKAQLFVPGMRVAVTPRDGRPNLFDLVGNPENQTRRWPRRVGKW